MKKVLAIVLALLVMSSMAVVAFATSTTSKCPKCGATISGATEEECADNLAKHVDHCPYVQCPYCEKYFADSETLADHKEACASNPANATTTVDALACPYCDYLATSKEDYNNHLTANHADKDGAKTTLWDTIQRQFDKYVMGYGENTADNSFTSIVRVFAYMVEVVMSVFTDSGAAGVFTDAGESGVAYFFETLVPQMFENLGGLFA